jgi:hypothetical protein
VREKRTERREGEGEWREKRTERREGEGEVREKRTEPRAEGMKELTGWVKATPDRDCLGILKVVERAETEEGVREKAVVYRVMREGKGEVLVREASGRRVRVAGVVTPGEGEPAIVIKEFRLLDAPAGEGERREKKIERREGEGEGEAREKPVRREGEGEWREKRPERREGEGEVREKRTEGEGGEERPKPRVEAGSVASPEILVGFRGMIEGTVVGKASDAIILRVDKVVKTWQSSTAKKPEALVGKLVSLTLKNEPNPNEALVKAVGEVKAGDRVLAGAIHLEGKAMQLVEVLRKLEAE